MGISVWLGHLGVHLSTEEGLQLEVDKTFRFGVLGAYRG
jgi:hypothetical protein